VSPVVFGIVFSHVDDSSAVRHRGEDWLRRFILGGSPFNGTTLVSSDSRGGAQFCEVHQHTSSQPMNSFSTYKIAEHICLSNFNVVKVL
jgi:hypothetical protein